VARRRTGRWPGKQDTRETILAAARQTFAEQGYDAASIRQIAAGAGVDPGLVHHYFGTKEQLFLTVVQPPIDPAVLLPKIFAGGREGIAERLVATFLSVWEGPASGPAFRSLVRGAVCHQLTGRLVREFFATQIVRRVVPEMSPEIDPAELPLRASLVASQLCSVRYLSVRRGMLAKPSGVLDHIQSESCLSTDPPGSMSPSSGRATGFWHRGLGATRVRP
jgi:AcrR family transcriptional regulator